MRTAPKIVRTALAATILSVLLLLPVRALAHCDTLDGPVVKAAQQALAQGNITPALRWLPKEDEPQIKHAFEQALAVRKLSPEAKALADTFFFETLVRLHRAGEGVPFTGLKPAGSDVAPGIQAADKALLTGSVDATLKLISDTAATGIRQRFSDVSEKQKHADDSVEAGRAFVAAYVEFIHYVEGIHQATLGTPAHGEESAETPKGHHGE